MNIIVKQPSCVAVLLRPRSVFGFFYVKCNATSYGLPNSTLNILCPLALNQSPLESRIRFKMSIL